jgi:HEPN domain-containing protein
MTIVRSHRNGLAKPRAICNFAKSSFEEFDDFYSQMCLLCHDAAEKYLKAFIVLSGNRPERIHDLVVLLNKCIGVGNNPGLQTIEYDCRILNQYYVPLKYPSHYPPATKEQAKEALEATEKIRALMLREIAY